MMRTPDDRCLSRRPLPLHRTLPHSCAQNYILLRFRQPFLQDFLHHPGHSHHKLLPQQPKGSFLPVSSIINDALKIQS